MGLWTPWRWRFPRRFVLLLVVVFLIYVGYHLRPATHGGVPTLPPLSAEEQAALRGREIALLSGHWGFDPGAVCDDGLSEVRVNRRLTQTTAQILRDAGAHPLLLKEYDPRLRGLRADAFLSIHSDSCISRSGFKIARWARSPHPQRDDRLVRCLRYNYWVTTGLPVDEALVTDDMRFYHAFSLLDPSTPAAIIEAGYLGGDRDLLTRRVHLPALGIARGLACFFQP